MYQILFALPFYLWIILMICEVTVEGISYVGWTVFLVFVVYGAGVRINMRDKYKIEGNMVEDFFAGKQCKHFFHTLIFLNERKEDSVPNGSQFWIAK